MHFVKKVPTTEEERLVREKEQNAKLTAFCRIRDKIFQLRSDGILGDEILQLTSQILRKQPDIYTFWTIRRSAIENKMNALKDSANNNSDSDTLESILDEELLLTQACLENSPKSYSTWFQRSWALQLHTSPNFKKELQLCSNALKLDCRNFHCWDHRRIVAKLAKLPDDEELEFSNKLIGENFSNYSAWHYRSCLLSRTHSSETGEVQLSEETLAIELDKVTNAFFTDPQDQSAWVYTKWLLDTGSEKNCLRADSHFPAVPLSVTYNGKWSTVVMSRACSINVLLTFVADDDSSLWKPVSMLSCKPKAAQIWLYLSTIPVNYRISIEHDLKSVSEAHYANKDLFYKAYGLVTRPVSKPITKFLANFKELMSVEKNNGWVLYMYTLFLMEITPIESNDEIMSNLKSLANTLDVQRKMVYESLISRQTIQFDLVKGSDGDRLLDNILTGKSVAIALRNRGLCSLTSLELLAGFVTDLDVSGNRLSDIDSILLPNLTSLTVNENPLRRFPTDLPFQGLTFLSAASTAMSSYEDIPGVLELKELDRFLFCETPLVEQSKEIANHLPNCRLIPYWL